MNYLCDVSSLLVGTAWSWPRHRCVDQAYEPFHIAQFIADGSRHRWRDAKALVDGVEIVSNEIQCERVPMVLDFLAEGVL
jgi:hypothetical protein